MTAPQATLQLADRVVEHRGEIHSDGFGADGRAPAMAGDHDLLGRLSLARIRLVIQFDVIADDIVIQVIESAQFLGDQRSVAVGPGDVVACDDDLDWRVHLGLPEDVELEFIRPLCVRTFSTVSPYSCSRPSPREFR
jgi:hypothetical protein